MIERIAAWLDSSRGRALLHAEAALMTEALDDCFGWEMLQVGAWGGARELLAAARTRRRTIVANPEWGTVLRSGADIAARLAHLPIASDSVDAVLLPHTLEFETDPYTVLREVDRILTGEGKLLLLGFSPLSLWGLRSAATRSGFPPGLRRLLSENAELATKLATLERRYDQQFKTVFDAIRQLMAPAESSKRPIGFTADVLTKEKPKK